MNSKKLTYIINKIDYGGAEVGMVRLLSNISLDNFDIAVITIRHVNPDLKEDLPDHITVHELNIESDRSYHDIKKSIQRIRQTDILVCSLIPSIFLGSIAGRTLRVPRIYCWRHTTYEPGILIKFVYSVSYHLSDGILTDSEATRENLQEWGIDESRIYTLPLSGVPVDDFPSVDHDPVDQPIRIGTVGRLVEKKGYEELMNCADELDEYEFHIIGEGPMREELRDASENVVCHGRVSNDELQRLWGTFDIYFQPSRYEGLCITAIEAMAAGLPVVASDIDGLSESVVDGHTGYLVDSGEIDEFCEKLQELGENPELRSQMGSTGEHRATSKYSSQALADKFSETVGPDNL